MRLVIVVCVAAAALAAAGGAGSGQPRQLLLSGPAGAKATLTEMPVARAVMFSPMPNLDYGEGLVVLRAGTCARSGRGVGDHVRGQIDYRFDVLRRHTFAIETYPRAGAVTPKCVEHRGREGDLRVTTPRAWTTLRARARGGVLEARSDPHSLRVTLASGRGGSATKIKVVVYEGSSGGAVGHLRRGTCSVRPTAQEIPLRVVDPGEPSPLLARPVEVAIPFAVFGKRRYVVEIHDENSGAEIDYCIEV